MLYPLHAPQAMVISIWSMAKTLYDMQRIKTLVEPMPISKTCQCRKFEILALINLSATYHDYNSRRRQVFCSFLRFNSYE